MSFLDKPYKGQPRRKMKMKRWQVIQRDGAYCCVCGEVHEHCLTVDHMISRSRGGSDTIDNMQILCKKCHSYKDGSKTSLKHINRICLMRYDFKV